MSRIIKNPSPTPKKRGRPKLVAAAAAVVSSPLSSHTSPRITRLSISESARKTRSSVGKAAAAGNRDSFLGTPTKPCPARGKTSTVQKKKKSTVAKSKKKRAKGKGKDLVGRGGDHSMTDDGSNGDNDDEPSSSSSSPLAYWLVKSEPESRMHKGKDVKFSLDDLKASEGPVAWDGVRNVVARNNLRAMSKGDQAFFYHSNCKVPGIVGVAEIVREHSVDDSAHDPESPYFDSKSTPAAPKWSMVHVEFRKRFKEIITLKDLNSYKQPGGVLADMQALKQSRLSVSKVTKEEWDFIIGLAEEQEAEEQEAKEETEEKEAKEQEV